MATKKAAAADVPRAAYTVVSNLSHDQADYAPGDELELTEDEAAPLLGHTVKPKADAPKS